MTRPTTPARRRQFRIAAVLLPLGLLLAAEAGLRVAGVRHEILGPSYVFLTPEGEYIANEGGLMMPDPDLFWRLRPGWRLPDGTPMIAPSGYRTDFDREKAAGVRRIVCLGDSSTFGLQVPASAAWPAVAERRLRRRGEPGAEVLNLGVAGYTSYQGLELLRRDVGALAPDVVVCAFGSFNDLVPAVGRTDADQGRSPFWASWRVVQVGAQLLARRTDGGNVTRGRLDDIDTRTYTGPRRVDPECFEENLAALVDGARELGADRVVLVVSPLPRATLERNPIATRYADLVAAVAGRKGARLVDGRPLFAASGRPEAALFADFCHPSPLGHAMLGDAVALAAARDGR